MIGGLLKKDLWLLKTRKDGNDVIFMKGIIKKIIRITSILILVYIISNIAIGIYISGIWKSKLTLSKAIDCFSRDYEKLVIVKNYLEESSYSSIVIYDYFESGIMQSLKNQLYIDDSDVIEAMEYLKKNGYNTIWKSKNKVEFQMWCNLDDSRGIVYSLDGYIPEVQFLTKLVGLSIVDWYYYEIDYSKWRIQND